MPASSCGRRPRASISPSLCCCSDAGLGARRGRQRRHDRAASRLGPDPYRAGPLFAGGDRLPLDHGHPGALPARLGLVHQLPSGRRRQAHRLSGAQRRWAPDPHPRDIEVRLADRHSRSGQRRRPARMADPDRLCDRIYFLCLLLWPAAERLGDVVVGGRAGAALSGRFHPLAAAPASGAAADEPLGGDGCGRGRAPCACLDAHDPGSAPRGGGVEAPFLESSRRAAGDAPRDT